MLSCPEVQTRVLPVTCPKDLVSLFAFSQDHTVSDLPVFSRLLSVRLLLPYSHNESNVYFPFRKSPLLLL